MQSVLEISKGKYFQCLFAELCELWF